MEWEETKAEKRRRFAKFVGIGLATGAIAGLIFTGTGLLFVRKAASNLKLPPELSTFNTHYNALLDMMKVDKIDTRRDYGIISDPKKISILTETGLVYGYSPVHGDFRLHAEDTWKRFDQLNEKEFSRIITPRVEREIVRLSESFTGLQPQVRKHHERIVLEQKKAVREWLKKGPPIAGAAALLGGAVGLGLALRKKRNGNPNLQRPRRNEPYTRRH